MGLKINGLSEWYAIRHDVIEEQGGLCAICGEIIRTRPHLDHCHETGYVRGALCGSCNSRLGWYERQAAAIHAYLDGAKAHRERIQREGPKPGDAGPAERAVWRMKAGYPVVRQRRQAG